MRHQLFIHDSDEVYAARVGAFVRDGLDAGEVVSAVTSEQHWRLVSEHLGSSLDDVAWIDRDHWYTRPEASLAGYDAKVRCALGAGASRVRVVGELPAFELPEERDRWTAYEAILNRAFARHPVSLMCVYDRREASPELLAGALSAHPELVDGDVSPCIHFRDPAELVRELTPPPRSVPSLPEIAVGDSSVDLRNRLADAMAATGVDRERIHDLLVAASEILANAWRHGDGLRAIHAGPVQDAYVCELICRGRGWDDPLAGYLPPAPEQLEGAGLWVARQLTRQLELVPLADGHGVRLWI